MSLDLIASLVALILTCAAAIASLSGDTWVRDDGMLRVTPRGWLALICFVGLLVTGGYKEFRAQRVNAEIESLREQLRVAEVASQRLIGPRAYALVRVRAHFADEVREKTGFFVGPDGQVLTTDFAVTHRVTHAPSRLVSVETVDGRSLGASIVHVEHRDLSVALLATGVRTPNYIELSDHPPEIGQQLLAMGLTADRFLTTAAAEITTIDAMTGIYRRSPGNYGGLGGGPLIDKSGTAFGLNWGALEPPVKGQASFVRADQIKLYLDAIHALRP